MTSLHKYVPRHRQRVNRTLDNKFQSMHKQRFDIEPPLKEGRSVPVYLIYKKNKLIVRAYNGMEYSELVKLLYTEIVKWEKK